MSMSIKEKILKIMTLALEIIPPEEEDIGTKKTAVFVRWAPHIPELEVDIHCGGWRKGIYPDKEYRVYTFQKDEHKELDEIIGALEEIRGGCFDV